MKYYIEYTHLSNLSGDIKYREEYKTEKEMLESLGLFQGAGYLIDSYGSVKEQEGL